MDPSSLPTLVALVVAAVAAVGWQLFRRPVQRRLAIRNILRRPAETALVVAGSLLGTAIITGSYVVGDTLDSSIRVLAKTQLGPIDETVTVQDAPQASRILTEIRALDDPRIDGAMSLVAVPASFAHRKGNETLAEPRAQAVELDFAAARRFGDDPSITGIDGPTPRAGDVVIAEGLATTLQARRGDTITAYLYGARVDLEVADVLPQVGVAGYWRGFESTSANAFVTPGTIQKITGGKIPPQSIPPSTTILVSNRGGIEEAARWTGHVEEQLDAVLESTELRVEPVKKETLDQAEAQGKEFAELFVGIGAFAIVAGVLLLVNIFVMLSEERKKQLGMLRAIGTRRSDLVRGFVIEGAFHALIAGALGAVAGIGVGWAIVKFAAPIFAGFGDFSLVLSFDADVASVVGGFCIGVLISLVTVLFTSFRISRVNIIRAIRDLPEPKVPKARRRTIVSGLAAALLAGAWFAAAWVAEEGWLALLLGPPIVAFGLLPAASRLVRRRAAVLVASGLSLFWGIAGNTITGGKVFEGGEIFAFVVQGVLLTFSAVVFLTQTQENLAHVLRAVAGRELALRLGLAYPLARRFRTGLTLGMYSLVLFTMVFIAVMATVFGGQVEQTAKKASAGFDMFVSASQTNPPREEVLRDVAGVQRVASATHGSALWQTAGAPTPEPWPVTGVDAEFLRFGGLLLDERREGLDSDREAWQELLRDRNAMIVDPFFLQAGGGPPGATVQPGDRIMMIDPVTGRRSEREVIAIYDTDAAFAGAYMARGSVESALGDRAAPIRFYVSVDDGADAEAVAARLQGELFENGVEAQTFRSQIALFANANLQFLRLMQGYLALGLLVGIAGLGVVMVRAVRERRHEVGVLRSLGFRSPQVASAFLLESGFIAIEGILIGAALALITSRQLITNGDFGEAISFVIPWAQVAILIAVAFVASLLATLWPARQAALIPPAVALRMAE